MDAYPATQPYITQEMLSPPGIVKRLSADELKPPKSPLEILAQAGASPRMDSGKTDYSDLVKKAIDAYNFGKGMDIYKNSDTILNRLSGPLGQLILVELSAIPSNSKEDLGKAFGLYGVLLRDVQRDIEGARVNYEKSIALNPKDHKVLTNLASLHFMYTGDLEAARKYIKMAHDIKPEDPVVKHWLKKINSNHKI